MDNTIPTRIAVLKCTCPMCGRPDTALRGDWSAYTHKNPTTGEQCHGPDPEWLFTSRLRMNGLDVRPDATQRLRKTARAN